MSLLQYTSEEMFSSTELIRKSKMVFDKLHKEEIEKAIILRDGKPSFMLLDFRVYETIMNEYLLLKGERTKPKEIVQTKNIPVKKIDQIEKLDESKTLDEKDLEEALAKIDKLDLDSFSDKEKVDSQKEPLKEFWE